MNDMNVKINFSKQECIIYGVKPIDNDYNSTRVVFNFEDNLEGRKVLEIRPKNSDTKEATFSDEIINNELILTRVDQEGKNHPVFTKAGTHILEVSLYGSDSKLSSVASEFEVLPEQVTIGDETAIVYLPVFDKLMQDLNTATNNANTATNRANEAATNANNAATATNNLNIDINKVDKTATIELTKKDGTTKSVNVNDGVSLQFMWQGTSLGIKTDDMENYVFVNLQGIQGIPGPQGEPFRIKKTYSSVAEMNADFDNMSYGDYVMIASTVEVEDNAKLYTRGESQWIFITDFSGATGIKGETGATPNIQIGTVTTGTTSSVTRTGTNENPILNFVLEKGETGQTGSTGPKGDTGFSPSASVTQLQNGALISITDETGTTTANIQNGEVTNKEFEYYKTISNVLPKVEDEDTEITLNNTGNAPLSIGLKGNTYQETKILPDEYTQVDYIESSGTQYIDANYSIQGNVKFIGSVYTSVEATEMAIIGASSDNTSKIEVGFSSTQNRFFVYSSSSLGITPTESIYNKRLNFNAKVSSTNPKKELTLNVDNNIYSYSNVDNMNYVGTNIEILRTNARYYFTGRLYKLSIYDNNILVRDFVPCYRNSDNEIGLYDLVNDTFYTNQGTGAFTYGSVVSIPNPDYPQDIHVVSGDNNVIVSNKNLFDSKDNNIRNNQRLDQNGQHTNDNGYYVTQFIKIDANTTYTKNSPTADAYHRVCFYTSNDQNTYISRSENNTFTTPTNAQYLRFCGLITELNTTMLEKSSTSTSYVEHQEQVYPISLGNIELCKIPNTTYEDDIRKSTGKNILDLSGFITQTNRSGLNISYSNGKLLINGTSTAIVDINLGSTYWNNNATALLETLNSKETNYVLSSTKSGLEYYFRMNEQYIQNTINRTKNDTISNLFVRISSGVTFNNELLGIQLEENSQATYWEPYGIKRIKYGAIGKAVLDGSENWIKSSSTALDRFILNGTNTPAFTNGLSNYFIVKNLTSIGYLYGNENQLIINFSSSGTTTLEQFKTWLSTHNTIVDYPLATPEITEITDSTLISQLDAIEYAMSYKDQTNISQENNDMPFVIPASAFKDLNTMFSEINNAIIELGGE